MILLSELQVGRGVAVGAVTVFPGQVWAGANRHESAIGSTATTRGGQLAHLSVLNVQHPLMEMAA